MRPFRRAEDGAEAVISCAHLTVGKFWDGTSHHYGRCQLGDSVARLALLRTQIAHSDAYVASHLDSGEPEFLQAPAGPPG